MSSWYPGKLIEDRLKKRRDPLVPPEVVERPEKGKEAKFLQYNKDEIFKNLLGAEGHLRKVAENSLPTGTILSVDPQPGFINCVVKHLADMEGNADEAVSHSAVVADEQTSSEFRGLRDDAETLRHRIQRSEINPFDAIKEVRKIRHRFEAFNPEYDVSKCKACEPVEALMKKAIENQKACSPQSET